MQSILIYILLTERKLLKILQDCDGLLLSGGPDLHPVYFGKQADSSRCDIDLVRDTLELALIKEAMSMNLPILGICRGEQILNVALGGSLIIDIPSDYQNAITHQTPNPDSCFHPVKVVEGTFLHTLTNKMIIDVILIIIKQWKHWLMT